LARELWGGDYDFSNGDEANRNRALLGVSGNADAGRCLITLVTENMPGAKAGIRVGDVILKVNGRDIQTFDQLKNIVAFKRPGDWLTLSIDRAGEKIELRAQLSRRDGTIPRERPDGEE
jgi:S1-C subfamily serine protease